MSKWVNVSEINNTLGKAIEACKDELTPAFYSGAKCVLDKINEIAEQTEPQSDARKFLGYACETCKHRDEEWDSEACDGCCENNDHYEAEDEPQTERATTEQLTEQLTEQPQGCIYDRLRDYEYDLALDRLEGSDL